MKLLSFLSSIILLFLFSGCHGNSDGQGNLSVDTLNVREKPVYSKNGKLQFIVEYKEGKANGRVREFYPNGGLYMDAIYKNNHRNGKCTFYFKNGKPFSVGYFINGDKDSIETKYSEDGRIIALVPYKKDKVQPGLREFKRDGSPLVENNSLIISEIDHTSLEGKYYLSVKLSTPHKDVKFYASPQSDPESRELLKITGESGILNVPIPSNGFVMKKLIFDAEYETQMRNTMRVQKLYNLAIDR